MDKKWFVYADDERVNDEAYVSHAEALAYAKGLIEDDGYGDVFVVEYRPVTRLQRGETVVTKLK